MEYLVKDGDEFRIVSEDVQINNFLSRESLTSKTTGDINQHRNEILLTFGDQQELVIRREYFIKDALSQFDFSNQKIFVNFEGERGHDMEGLTRCFFSDFWEEFVKTNGIGSDNFSLSLNLSTNMFSDTELINLGKILAAVFILTSYVLPFVNHAQLYYLLCDKMATQEFTLHSFLSCLDEEDTKLFTSEFSKHHSGKSNRLFYKILNKILFNSYPYKCD